MDTITLGTSILGRGTTIKTTDRVNHNGGIHVIIDGLHETSSRNQEQYKARTARGDNSGSTQEFFCEKDIPEELRRESYKGISHDEIYNEVYENIDARTSAIRNYVVQFVEETVQKLNEIDETPKMSEAYKEQAKALLTQRAFSIKNRACGVSDKFQSNIEEYKREIEAYAALYVAKYKVTDKEYLTNEGRFDEAKWLSKNGYPDVAKTHIPFRRKTEQEIFKKNNIKESKRKEEPISKLKVEQKPEVPKQTESEKITTEEFDQAIPEDKREEIIVADIARGIEAKESEENKTLEETAELKTENLEFNKKSAYAQLSNWGRMSIKKIQEKLGIKTMIWDLKNSRNLRTSAVQNCYSELKDAIKEQENMKENNVGEATKNQDETSER